MVGGLSDSHSVKILLQAFLLWLEALKVKRQGGREEGGREGGREGEVFVKSCLTLPSMSCADRCSISLALR